MHQDTHKRFFGFFLDSLLDGTDNTLHQLLLFCHSDNILVASENLFFLFILAFCECFGDKILFLLEIPIGMEDASASFLFHPFAAIGNKLPVALAIRVADKEAGTGIVLTDITSQLSRTYVAVENGEG